MGQQLKARVGLEQKQKLSQKLSPQQIQYIKLLQLPTLELEQRIKDEMEENPLLEEGPDEEIEHLEETIEQDKQELMEEEEEAKDEAEKELEEAEEDFDWDYFLDNANDNYGYKARVDGGGGEEHEDIPTPYESTLIEDLEAQIDYLGLDETERVIADQIIGSIDPDGYFRREMESVIDDIMFNEGMEVDEEQIEAILEKIQRLDPIGIASRDLRECLLTQLEEMDEDTPYRDTAIELLKDHYKSFTMKHFDKIQNRLDLTKSELKETFELIRSLNPKPGEGEFSPSQNYITPDFRVDYNEDEFLISLNGDNAPQLRISRHYRQMLNEMAAEEKGDEEEDDSSSKTPYDEEAKDFLKNKMESAKWFIDSINQRRHTMMKTMHAIVELQEEFFKTGPGNLKPMILKDVAEIIDMDISTVSRVVNGKYVQTEFGVYELKYFFSEGITTDSGEEISNKEVKARLQEIVDNEDKTDPLSDQKLADRLAEDGYSIARRTVTKYRKQLGIPVARLRKEIVLDEEE